MAGAGVRIDGRDAALAQLGAYAARLGHAQPMWDAIGAALVTSTERRFETGIGSDGNPWPPSLRVLAHGGKTLVLSTRLLRSITHIASDAGVEVGTNVVYAAIHQFGGTVTHAAREQELHFRRTRKGNTRFAKAGDKRVRSSQTVTIGAHTATIPARPFLGIDDDDEREIIQIGEDFLRAEAP